MLSHEQQHQANLCRLQAYRNKQTAEQRCRSQLAEQITDYGKQLGLGITQIYCAIRIALKQLEYGHTPADALGVGVDTIQKIRTSF